MKKREEENDLSWLMAMLSTFTPPEKIIYSKPITESEMSDAIVEIQRYLIAEDKRFDDLNLDITDINNKLKQLNDNVAEVDNRMDNIDKKVEIEDLKQQLIELQKYIKHYLKLTEEQEKQIENRDLITETLSNAKSVTIEEGSVCEIKIPEVTSTTTVTAPLDDYTTLELTSTKGVTLNNSANNIVDLDITAPKDGSTPTITLNGSFGKINVENASTKVNGSVNELNITKENNKSTSISGTLAETTTISSESNKPITINNNNENSNLVISTPESTVTLGGKYNEVTSKVSDNTLNINSNAHINRLIVEKGNVIVKDRDVNNIIDEIINDTDYTVTPYTTYAKTMSELNSGMQIGGKTIVQNDIDAKGSGVAFGILASGNIELDLNGKTVKGGRSNTGLMFIRGSANVNIVGEGTLENTNDNYGVWVSSAKAIVNIYGGNYIATTHCLYAENGTINIYDGTFKLKNEDKTFLLNCLDASYKSGKAKINVYGGKFYGFNPAESMSEPDGPISFVAPGYHVEEFEEDGERVYQVIANN